MSPYRTAARQRTDASALARVLEASLAVILLSASGCARLGSTAGDPATVTIAVINETSRPTAVHFRRVGTKGELLGRVASLSRREFRISREFLTGQVVLFDDAAVDTFGSFATLPFEVFNANRIEWVIREDQRLASVRVR